MNSMAQQAVPNGNGQNELRVDQSSRASNLVVTQLSPIMLIASSHLSPGSLPPIRDDRHKLGKCLSYQSFGLCVHSQLQAPVHGELLVDVVQVDLDRSLGDQELLGDRAVA